MESSGVRTIRSERDWSVDDVEGITCNIRKVNVMVDISKKSLFAAYQSINEIETSVKYVE